MAETLKQRLERVSKVQKSTLVVSQDQFRVDETGVYRFDFETSDKIVTKAKGVWRALLAREDIEGAVLLVGPPGSGKSTWLAHNKQPNTVYFDATNTQKKKRRKLILVAREAGKPISAVAFSTPVEMCEERNATRPPGRRVPHFVVQQMATQLADEPPSEEEGFESVVFVTPL